MATTPTPDLTDAEKKDIRGAARQAEEAVALIVRISNRKTATPGDLGFPILALKKALEMLARKARLDL